MPPEPAAGRATVLAFLHVHLPVHELPDVRVLPLEHADPIAQRRVLFLRQRLPVVLRGENSRDNFYTLHGGLLVAGAT